MWKIGGRGWKGGHCSLLTRKAFKNKITLTNKEIKKFAQWLKEESINYPNSKIEETMKDIAFYLEEKRGSLKNI